MRTRDVQRMLQGGEGLWLASGSPDLRADDGIVLETSGSTGAPKPIRLRRQQLVAAAQANAEYFGCVGTWHLALPTHYIAGLMVIVRGLLGDGVRACASDLSDIELADGHNFLSIVPTQLIRALDRGIDLSGFTGVLVGGAPLSADVRERAKAAGVKVVETYGMSETCGGIVYDGVPLPGVEVALEDGRVRISGEMVQGGTILTNDRGRWEEGRLKILGRVDDIIITGGLKADLAVVRAEVLRHDPDAWVLAVPDPEWGQRIVLFARNGSLEEWRGRLDLPKHALPRQFIALETLPRTAGGKPDRERLLLLLGT